MNSLRIPRWPLQTTDLLTPLDGTLTHDEAKTPEETDWRQILVLYDMLHLLAPGPMVTLNRVVAFAMIHGAGAALDELSKTVDEEDLAHTHRLHAVRAHLLEMVGVLDAAVIDHQL